jgi:hypothetical protein
VSGQVTEFPNRGGRHEAAPQQPVLQQLRDPRTILDVGFPTRDLLDVGGIHQQAREGLLQRVEHGFPINARALHRHVRDPVRLEPVAQGQEFGGGRSECPHVLRPGLPRPRHAYARGDGVPMDVQPTASLDLPFHDAASSREIGRGPEELRYARFCSACSNATMRGAESSHVKLHTDSLAPTSTDDVRTATGACYAIFILRGWAEGP